MQLAARISPLSTKDLQQHHRERCASGARQHIRLDFSISSALRTCLHCQLDDRPWVWRLVLQPEQCLSTPLSRQILLNISPAALKVSAEDVYLSMRLGSAVRCAYDVQQCCSQLERMDLAETACIKLHCFHANTENTTAHTVCLTENSSWQCDLIGHISQV